MVVMADHLNSEKRSWNMSRIRSKNTSPELKVRKYLYSKGIRYRLHRKDLPGNPDIVISKIKTVIFTHGCFWHQHELCKRANIPKTRPEYWISKLNNNKERDKIVRTSLQQDNWKVIVIWECELQQIQFIKDLQTIYEDYHSLPEK